MKIFNLNKNQILDENNIDLKWGHLVPDKLIIEEEPASITQQPTEHGIVTITKPEKFVTEDILIYIPYTEKDLVLKQIEQLEDWFKTEYRYYFEKYSRKISMNLRLRDGSDPNVKLNELFALAETNAQLLHSLRNNV